MTDRAYLAWRRTEQSRRFVADGPGGGGSDVVAVVDVGQWHSGCAVAGCARSDVRRAMLRRVLGDACRRAAGAVCLLAVVGMLRAFDLPFKERLGGLRPRQAAHHSATVCTICPFGACRVGCDRLSSSPRRAARHVVD